MSYFVLAAISDESNGVVIERLPDGCPADWRFNEGVSLLSEYPSNVALSFSSNYPDNRKLFDFVRNILGLFIISVKVKTLLENIGVNNVEFLPVRIKDHRGNLVADNYSILNLLGGEEIIDMEKSKYKMNAMEKDQIGRLDELVVKHDAIRADAKIFRAAKKMRLVFVRDDVRDVFVKEGVTGYKLFPADGWDGLYI